MSNVSVEEKVLFYDKLEELTRLFYQYMHGNRTQPDGGITVFKEFAKFYEADWIGLIDVDCNFESWSAKCFYNAVTESTTETLIGKPERFESAPSWVDAVRTGCPIVVEDVDAIKETNPIEYEMYKRLEVDSVIGVPYRNLHKGLMVIKNPKRFKSEAMALNVMSYIATMEIIEVNRRKNVERNIDPSEPNNYQDIGIKLFGDFTIRGKEFLISNTEMKSELTKFAVAYLTVNQGKTFSKDKLSSVYFNGMDTASWPDIFYKFRQKCRDLRPGLDHYLCDIIDTNNSGYCLSKRLNFNSDVEYFEHLVKLIDDAGNTMAKIEVLKEFYSRFQEDFLPGETECEWILTVRKDYRRRYLEKMILMLQLLFDTSEYSAVIKYGTALLKRFPHSVEIRFWQAISYWELRQADIVKNTIDAAQEIFMDYEWELFMGLLEKYHNDSEAKKYIKACIATV